MKILLKTGMLLTLLLCLWMPDRVLAGDIAVIANSHFPVDAVNLRYLKKVYLGKKGREAGMTIHPLDYHKHHALKRDFIAKILSSTVGKYQAYWLKQLFREGTSPPEKLKDTEALIAAVRKKEGAIGYLYLEDLQDKQGLKILLVIK